MELPGKSQKEHPARIGVEKEGVSRKLMEHLATYLRNTGDASAIVGESESGLPSASPFTYSLILRWGLKEISGSAGTSQTIWESRGVMVQASGSEDTGIIRVYFTGDARDTALQPKDMVTRGNQRSNGWINLKEAPVFKTYRQMHIMRQEEFSEKKELPLEEQIRFAMILASLRPDYRYGAGNVSGPIQENSLVLAA